MVNESNDAPLFPPLTHEAWESMVRKSLKGKEMEFLGYTTAEGVEVPWRVDAELGSRTEGLPERWPRKAGAAIWEAQIQQTFLTPDALMQGLVQGVEGVRIPELQQNTPGLHAMLEGVHLEMVAVHLDGFEATGSLRSLVALADGRSLSGSCTRDVMRPEVDGERLALHVEAWGVAMPVFQTWGIDVAPWIDAGMTPVRALSAAFAALDDAADGLVRHGVSLEEAVRRCTIRWGVDSDLLAEATALRAIRWLWARWLSDRGLPDVPVWVEARTTSLRHVWAPAEDNLLRTTAATWAAWIGGADGVETLSHDHRQGLQTEHARRCARNISHLLREESGLHRVWDPLQGSHQAAFLSWTWVERAWEGLLDWRARGGWKAGCANGDLHRALQASRADQLRSPIFLPRDAAGGSVALESQDVRSPWFLADALLAARAASTPQ